MRYSKLSILDFAKQIISDNGKTIKESIYDLRLQSSDINVYFNIVSELENKNQPVLAMVFLKESLYQHFKI